MKHRILSEKNKYYIPKEDYLTAIHYALRYPLMLAELNDARDTSSAIRYDKDKVQSTPTDDVIFNAAVRASELSEKISLIEDAIAISADGMETYLKMGVCYGLTFRELEGRGIPCGHKKYYEIRRRFYYELSKKI